MGIPRTVPVTDETRGPDSVECTPALLRPPWDPTEKHEACFFDYTRLGHYWGFLCGCRCHDVEPELPPCPPELCGIGGCTYLPHEGDRPTWPSLMPG